MALKSADYAKYKDMNAYVVPNFQNEEEWCKGKGAGTAECKGYTQQAQNNNSNPTTPDNNQSPTPQPGTIVFKI